MSPPGQKRADFAAKNAAVRLHGPLHYPVLLLAVTSMLAGSGPQSADTGNLLHCGLGLPVGSGMAVITLLFCLYLALQLHLSRVNLRQLRAQLQQAHNAEADLRGQLCVLRNCAPDAVLSITAEGFIDSFNPAAEQMFGWNEAEIVNRHFHELFFTEQDADCGLHEVLHISSHDLLGQPREIMARRRDGSSFVAEYAAADLARAGQRGILAIVRDVTTVREHEHRLQHSELRLREAQQLAQLGNLELDFASGRMFWSDELFHLFGLQPTWQEPDMRLFISLLHPEDRDNLELALDRLIRQGSCHEQHYRLLPQSGCQTWHHARFIVDRDDTGRARRLLATVQDVSAQYENEEKRRQMDEKLSQIRKLETIGAVSSAIAHDFNNILTPIIGFTDLSLDELEHHDIVHRHLQQVRQGANRARELVRRILSFSDVPAGDTEVLALRPLVDEVLGLLSVRAGRQVELIVKDLEGPLYVRSDPTQLHQVLLNLCTNALQAIGRHRGRIEVRLESTRVDLDMLDRLPALSLGHHAVLSVVDTGHGISTEDREQIFEPFFSSRSKDAGSGLGLSVVHGIVLALGGEIEVQSEPGSGSTFRVYLPLCRDQPAAAPPLEPAVPGGSESILFVDDEPDINSYMLLLLEKLGYRVTACRAPVLALDMLREQPQSFDLLITDLTMPRMNGEKLVRCLREMHSNIPVILITGFSEGLSGDIIDELRIGQIVRKPLIRHELALAIRHVLGSVMMQVENDANPVGG
jgi:PAS domain S-box-containing protein